MHCSHTEEEKNWYQFIKNIAFFHTMWDGCMAPFSPFFLIRIYLLPFNSLKSAIFYRILFFHIPTPESLSWTCFMVVIYMYNNMYGSNSYHKNYGTINANYTVIWWQKHIFQFYQTISFFPIYRSSRLTCSKWTFKKCDENCHLIQNKNSSQYDQVNLFFGEINLY